MPYRRHFLATAGALLAGGTALTAGATASIDDDGTADPGRTGQATVQVEGWSMFGGGPGHACAVTSTSGPTGEPSLAWSVSAGWGRSETRSSAPAVVDGTVYVGLTKVGEDDDVVGGKVVALDSADGTERWDFPPGCGGWGFLTPAVADGTVYLADTAGFVYAVDAETGEQRWLREVASNEPTSELAVVDGTVYVSGDRTYALDAADGESRWTSESLDRPSFWNGRLFGYDVREGEFTLVAVEADTGEETWTATLPGSDGGTLDEGPPPVGGGLVLGLVRGTDGVFAFDASDGTTLWDDAGDGLVRPAVTGERVYGSFWDGPGLHAHDAGTGEEAWSTETRSVRRQVATDDAVYLVRESNGPVLEAYGADDGTRRWQVSASAGEMAVADGSVYLSDRGVVVAHR